MGGEGVEGRGRGCSLLSLSLSSPGPTKKIECDSHSIVQLAKAHLLPPLSLQHHPIKTFTPIDIMTSTRRVSWAFPVLLIILLLLTTAGQPVYGARQLKGLIDTVTSAAGSLLGGGGGGGGGGGLLETASSGLGLGLGLGSGLGSGLEL